MNQQCKVCGEPAAGFHFGAFTCEGCKSFFGRSYNNLGSITECKNNGECVINKKNRTSCKACRLRKCLLVGMSKSGSRYGRRSNWFKIHCLLQEQQQQQQNQQQQNPLLPQQLVRPQKTSPPPTTQSALGMLGHQHPHLDPRLHHQLAAAMSHHHHHQPHQQRFKEEFLMLGLDEYKNSTSPTISSPESHNSDSSVEVSDQRLASRTPGLFKDSPPPPQPAAHKDGMFMPLPFASLASLYPHAMAAAATAFMQQPTMFSGAAAAGSPFLFPHHGNYIYSTAGTKHQQHNNNHPLLLNKTATPTTTLNNNTINAAADKRFFLDAILQSQRASGSPRSDPEEDRQDDDGTSSPRQHSPTLLHSDHEQENPMDLSMKGCRIKVEDAASLSPRSGTDEDDEARSESSVSQDGGGEHHEDEGDSSGTLVQHRTTPIDLTTRA